MKNSRPFYSLCFLLTFLISSFSVNAQDETKDQMYWIHQEKAKVNMLDQYEKTSHDVLEMFKEGGLDFNVFASQRDDNLFFYLIPISGFSSVDSIYKEFNAASEKVGKDKWSNLMVENSSTMESSKDAFISRSAKYSYVPKNPRLKPDEIKFIHFDYFTVLPEKRKEFFDLAAQYKELNETNDIGMGYNVWLPEFGFDNNLVVVTTNAKDNTDFSQTNNMVNEKLGKKGKMLWEQMLKTLKNFTHINGRFRDDLSMMK
jgi:hypothetical protein